MRKLFVVAILILAGTLLAQTSEGRAPEKFQTVFLIQSVTPIAGDECNMIVDAGEMRYIVSGNRDAGGCNHLPGLGDHVWGRVRHSGFAEQMRQSGVADVASEYVDLVYWKKDKLKYQAYRIDIAQQVKR